MTPDPVPPSRVSSPTCDCCGGPCGGRIWIGAGGRYCWRCRVWGPWKPPSEKLTRERDLAREELALANEEVRAVMTAAGVENARQQFEAQLQAAERQIEALRDALRTACWTRDGHVQVRYEGRWMLARDAVLLTQPMAPPPREV